MRGIDQHHELHGSTGKLPADSNADCWTTGEWTEHGAMHYQSARVILLFNVY